MSFLKLENKPIFRKVIWKYFRFGSKFGVKDPFVNEKNTPQYEQLDSPFEMWFQYQLRYWLKVLANLGFSFGIRPRPKYWFQSYTTMTFEKWNWDLFPIFFSISTTANTFYQPFRISPGNMCYLTTWLPSTPVRFFSSICIMSNTQRGWIR